MEQKLVLIDTFIKELETVNDQITIEEWNDEFTRYVNYIIAAGIAGEESFTYDTVVEGLCEQCEDYDIPRSFINDLVDKVTTKAHAYMNDYGKYIHEVDFIMVGYSLIAVVTE